MTNQNNETAIQNEQQSILRNTIINDIIIILSKNNISISEANDILYTTLKKIQQQPVISSS